MREVSVGRACRTYLLCPIHGTNADDVCLREPPVAQVLRGVNHGVHAAEGVVKGERLLGLLEPERGLYVEGDLEHDAGAAEAAKGGHEEVRALIARTADARAICEKEDEGEDVHGKDGEVDAGAVGSGGHYACEGLVGDGTEVDHGEAMVCEGGVEGGEGNAALCDDIVLVCVDLGKEDGEYCKPKAKKAE